MIGQVAFRVSNLLLGLSDVAFRSQPFDSQLFTQPQQLGFGLAQRGFFACEILLERRRVEANQHVT